MRQSIAPNLKPLAAPVGVMPPFVMFAPGVFTIVDKSLPAGSGRVELGQGRRLATIDELMHVAQTAVWARDAKHGDRLRCSWAKGL